MTTIHVRVLGSTRVVVDGVEVRLTPLTIRLLLRLIAAGGELVTARQLYRDVWDLPPGLADHRQRNRNEVQKRVFELRRALALGKTGAGAGILRTEQILRGREPQSAYRLVLSRAELDALEFADLVNAAAHVPQATAHELLTRAVDLWHGVPFADAGEAPFVKQARLRLTRLHEIARRELIQLHTHSGDLVTAHRLAVMVADENPDDSGAHRLVAELRGGLRARHGDEILRRHFSGLRATLVICTGDLLDQNDANLVVGFGDTFDTSTDRDIMISSESIQGQLLRRVFGGDVRALDAELRRGLRMFTPVAVESKQDKRKGKRTRYPIGTVVPIPLDGRRIFAVACARQGNDMVTKSTGANLRLSLRQLWSSVAVHGLLKPVAIPLIGSGLARITDMDHQQILFAVIDSFLQACREEWTVTDELRVVILPRDLPKIKMTELAGHISALDDNGSR